MKIVRYRRGETGGYGIWDEGDGGQGVITPLRGNPFVGLDPILEEIPAAETVLLAPCLPSKLVCVGANYRDHARELGRTVPTEPLIFMKPSTALLDPGADIRYPHGVTRLDYEGELALVVKARAHRVKEEEAAAYVLGYTCANDVTARDIQLREGHWTRAKSFDTFAPLGPWIETELDPGDVVVESFLNGQRRQHSTSAEMVFNPARLLSFISHVMTLLPGDVILTGTPFGIGSMEAGDEIEVRIQGIGSLINRVAGDPQGGER